MADTVCTDTGQVLSIFPIKTDELDAYILRSQRTHHIERIYQALPRKMDYPTTASENPEQRIKIRYRDILPYDYNRVKLSILQNQPHSHFINASHVHKNAKHYIAAQGPTDNTVPDFWRMIWEHKIEAVVMLTNPSEGGRSKCAVYWPESDTNKKFGKIQVEKVDTKVFPGYTVRKFQLKRNRETRQLQHYHFQSWPDHGAPAGATAFLSFLGKVQAKTQSCTTPLLIHCSAGVGRTGTFIALDQLINQGKKNRTVDAPACIYELRRYRSHMVQSVDQFKFIYQALQEHFKQNSSQSKTSQRNMARHNSYRRSSRNRKSVIMLDKRHSSRHRLSSIGKTVLNQLPWIHGNVSSRGAEYLLSTCKIGTFMIRNSDHNPLQLVISLRTEHKVIHYFIKEDSSKVFIRTSRKFGSLLGMLQYYSENANGIETKLTYPVTRENRLVDKWDKKIKKLQIGQRLVFEKQAQTLRDKTRKRALQLHLKARKSCRKSLETAQKNTQKELTEYHGKILRNMYHKVCSKLERGKIQEDMTNEWTKETTDSVKMWRNLWIAETQTLDVIHKVAVAEIDGEKDNCKKAKQALLKRRRTTYVNINENMDEPSVKLKKATEMGIGYIEKANVGLFWDLENKPNEQSNSKKQRRSLRISLNANNEGKEITQIFNTRIMERNKLDKDQLAEKKKLRQEQEAEKTSQDLNAIKAYKIRFKKHRWIERVEDAHHKIRNKLKVFKN